MLPCSILVVPDCSDVLPPRMLPVSRSRTSMKAERALDSLASPQSVYSGFEYLHLGLHSTTKSRVNTTTSAIFSFAHLAMVVNLGEDDRRGTSCLLSTSLAFTDLTVSICSGFNWPYSAFSISMVILFDLEMVGDGEIFQKCSGGEDLFIRQFSLSNSKG